MKLLIVESPSKAKTIEKYLEGVYTVRASVGHIRDLPKSNKEAIDIEGGFIPHYEISKGKEKIVHELQNLAKKSDEILLATDPDREGEAIAWHVSEILKKKENLTRPSAALSLSRRRTLGEVNIPIKRVRFFEITKEAVGEAIKKPDEIDQKLVKAQEARRVLDRLVGYDLSGLIWKKVRYGLSAGRVQSPALRIIMEREREIRAFVPEQYFILEGLFQTIKKEKLKLFCSEQPKDEKEAKRILELGEKNKWFVKDLKESEQKRSSRPPFTTSTLQQTASTRLGFSPSRTMQIAQKLYEAGHITYMRTDSVNLSLQAQEQILKVIEKKYGKEYAEKKFYKAKSKNAQEAHEAIRPSHIEETSAGINEEQKKLYRLIWERAVASQMADAKLLKTKVIANLATWPPSVLGGQVAKLKIPDFSATSSRILFAGWLICDTGARGENIELPKVEIEEELKLLKLVSNKKFTEPPDRYTEAGLVKELEWRDIGRPSTYASIMKTLEDRGYVKKEGRTLYPTDVGEVVSDFLEKYFAKYISDTFTAEMEDELDEISRGERDYRETLENFYGPFSEEVKSKENLEKATNLGKAPKDIKCPKCGGEMIIKLSRKGKFYSCSKYPDCSGALRLDGTEVEGPKETGEICPKCGSSKSGKLIIRERRDGSGTFISCSRYPKCKFIKKDEVEEARKKTGVKCPECKNGEISERRGRFGTFYSCSNYPNCQFAIKAKPTGNICPKCGNLMMEGTKTIPERCSNKNCENHNPHKLKKVL